jgi:hypothetical protein
MEPLRRRIENLLLPDLQFNCSHWYICRLLDRVLVEVENEVNERRAKEATTDKSIKEPELPL